MTISHNMNDSHYSTRQRRQKEQAERRRAILEAAREVFFDKGFMAATVEAIAGRCGLAKGTIYLYFKGKEELYISILAEGLGLLKKEFAKITQLSRPADLLLGQILETYFAFYQRHRQYFGILFLSSQPDVRERVPEDLFRQCMDIARDCMQVVSQVIQQGMDDAIFRRVNPWVKANILWATVNGIIMCYEQDPMYRDEVLDLSLEEILQQALDLALNGLRSGA